MASKKLTFLEVDEQFLTAEDNKDLLQMVQMLHLGFTKHKDIIKIYDRKLPKKGLQDLIHESHERVWGIAQTERHNEPFVKPLTGLIRYFPFVTRSNSDLVIAELEIKLREN